MVSVLLSSRRVMFVSFSCVSFCEIPASGLPPHSAAFLSQRLRRLIPPCVIQVTHMAENLRRLLCLTYIIALLALAICFLLTRSTTPDQLAQRFISSRHLSDYKDNNDNNGCAPEKYLGAVQASRRHTQRHACSSLGLYNHDIYDAPLPRSSYSRNMYVSERYQAIFCLMPKVSSNNWMRTLLVLEGVFNKTDRMTPQEVTKAGKKYAKGFAKYNGKSRFAMLKNFTTILIVRNPFTRLLSAFRDRLETYPNRNLFHRHMHNKNIYMMFGNHSKEEMPHPRTKSELYNVTFREFVDYYLSGRTDVHWREQHKVCPPCLTYDYIGKIETYADDYNQILTLIGANNKVRPLPAPHATHSSENEILRHYYETLSKGQFKRLTQVLSTDMKLFGYSVPEILQM